MMRPLGLPSKIYICIVLLNATDAPPHDGRCFQDIFCHDSLSFPAAAFNNLVRLPEAVHPLIRT